MARSRILKPEFWSDEKLAQVAREARLAFAGLWTCSDDYGVTKELHLPDKTSSLLATGGSESGGKTTLEFAIPLASRDAQDVTLVPGQDVAVILAYHATQDSFTAEHTRYSQAQITLD